MKFTRIVGVFAVAALALGLAACGDEEQDDQNRGELVEAANRICHKFDRRLSDIEEPRNPRNTEQAAAYFDEVSPVFEASYIEFKALDPNDDLERDWGAFVDKQRELRDVSRKVAEKTIKGDRSYINDLSELESITSDSERITRKIGARTCAT